MSAVKSPPHNSDSGDETSTLFDDHQAYTEEFFRGLHLSDADYNVLADAMRYICSRRVHLDVSGKVRLPALIATNLINNYRLYLPIYAMMHLQLSADGLAGSVAACR
jgi:hypothetical protein